jgi:serine/threonine protein kinase/tetratricopeptide (TPR) repeat protein
MPEENKTVVRGEPIPDNKTVVRAAPVEVESGEDNTADHISIADTRDAIGNGSNTPGNTGNSATADTDAPEIVPGYRYIEELGKGGMGVVYKARHTKLNRVVALKMLLGDGGSSSSITRFLTEAKAVAAIRHKNVVQVHDYGEVNGRPYMALEFLPGGVFSSVIAQRRTTLTSPTSLLNAVTLLTQVTRGVAAAHSLGIIHRDLKPANVLLDENGVPKVADFGLAKDAEEANFTQAGVGMGTPAYMAPEQARDAKDVGPEADVWALGVMLYEVIAGKKPFTGTLQEIRVRAEKADPPPLREAVPNLAVDLELICLKCLAKDPKDRYANANELADDLDCFLAGEPISFRPPGFVERATRWLRRRRVTVGVSLALLLALGITLFALNQAKRTGNESKRNDEQAAILQTLPTGEWNDTDLQRLDTLTNDLATRDAERAENVRTQIDQALTKSGQDRLQQPTLTDADEAYVTRVATLLQPRNPTLAERLKQEHAARKKAWVRVFRVEPPTHGIAGIFDPLRGGNKVAVLGNPDRFRFDQPIGSQSLPQHLTAIECRGNVEIVAKFAPSWDRADCLGVALNVASDRETGGYSLVLRPGLPPRPNMPPSTFGESKAEGSTIHIHLYRNDVIIQKRELLASQIGNSLTVTLQRAGDRVLAQVNALPPIVHRDLFPLAGRGVYGVIGRTDLELAMLEGRTQQSGTTASPLERADELFLAGDYTGAITLYEQQAVAAAGKDAAAEARFKIAVCLRELRRFDDAQARLRELYAQGINPWSRLAGCYLVAVLIQQRKTDEANELLDKLTSELQPGENELAALLPDNIREDMLKSLRDAASGFSWLKDDPQRVSKVARVVRAEDALGVGREYTGWTRLSYIRALRASGKPEDLSEATRLLGIWLQNDYPPGDNTGFGSLLAAEFAWLMREMNTPQVGLDEVNRRVFSAPGIHRADGYQLLLERARMHYTLKQYDEAKADLVLFLKECPPQYRVYRWIADASLMLGLLYHREGDNARAQEAWRVGLPKKPLAQLRIDTAGGIGLLTTVALQSVTNTLKEAELLELLRTLMGDDFIGKQMQNRLQLHHVTELVELANASMKKPASYEVLRNFAFQTGSLRSYSRDPVAYAVAEMIRSAAFGNTQTDGQDSLAVVTANTGVNSYARGQLNMLQLLQVALTAQGKFDADSWSTFHKQLPKEFRMNLSCTLGYRYLRLNKPADAAIFFRATVADADVGSPLRKQAEAELAKIEKK